MNQKKNNLTILIDIGLVLLVVLTRMFSASRYLHKWDSVQFALALHDYDITRHQPHPTGYPGYIGLAWLIRTIVADDNTALIAVGVFSALVIVLVTHHLGRFFLGDRGGFVAGLLAALNPLLWYFSSIGLSYIAGLAFAMLAVWAAVMGSGRLRLLGPLLAGVASTIWLPAGILIFPVIIWSYLRNFRMAEEPDRKLFVNSVITGVALFLIPVVIFYIPVIIDTGGFGEYMVQIRSESGKHVLRFQNWMSNPALEFTETTGSIANLLNLGLGMSRWLLLVLLIPVAGEIGSSSKKVIGFLPLAVISFVALYWGTVPFIRAVGIILFLFSTWNLLPTSQEHHGRNRMWFFLWWIVPGFILWTLIYVNYVGILIFFLPPLILLVAWNIERAAEFMVLQTVREPVENKENVKDNSENLDKIGHVKDKPDLRIGKFIAWVLIVLVAMNDIGGFIDADTQESWYGIVSNDMKIESVIEAIQKAPVPLDQVILLGDSGGYRHWAYYITEPMTIWVKYLLYNPIRETTAAWGSRDRNQQRFFPTMIHDDSIEDGIIASIPLDEISGIIAFNTEMARFKGSGTIYTLTNDPAFPNTVRIEIAENEALIMFDIGYESFIEELGFEPIAYYLDAGNSTELRFGGGVWWLE